MVIQRLQSLFLLLAVLVMCCFCLFVPIAASQNADGTVTHIFVRDIYAMLIINGAITVLMFVDIFLYKNLKLQINITLLILWLLVASMAIGCFVLLCRMPADYSILWVGATLLMVVALILVIMARRRMKADQRLLRSYERLR
ncbi:MAG: DUF4293 domain-containing protein [Bacteroidales bacterium]|nr:DUF4293 domain-containing protein [Bacteroidales bacterium]MCD8385412.1 DUF4293 domain-containing protein [Bacteroidales bacterium]